MIFLSTYKPKHPKFSPIITTTKKFRVFKAQPCKRWTELRPEPRSDFKIRNLVWNKVARGKPHYIELIQIPNRKNPPTFILKSLKPEINYYF